MFKSLLDYFSIDKEQPKPSDILGGDIQLLHKFSLFYRENRNALIMLMAISPVRWASKVKDFDAKELQAFNDGLSLGLGFFEDCFLEVENKSNLTQDENTKQPTE